VELLYQVLGMLLMVLVFLNQDFCYSKKAAGTNLVRFHGKSFAGIKQVN
jgi:hypothetical protein